MNDRERFDKAFFDLLSVIDNIDSPYNLLHQQNKREIVFDQIDVFIDNLIAYSQMFDGADHNSPENDSIFDRIEYLEDVLGSLSDINSDEITDLGERIDTVESQSGTNSDNITSLDGRVVAVESQSNTNTANIASVASQLNTAVDDLDGRVVAVESQSNTNTANIASVASQLSTAVDDLNSRKLTTSLLDTVLMGLGIIEKYTDGEGIEKMRLPKTLTEDSLLNAGIIAEGGAGTEQGGRHTVIEFIDDHAANQQITIGSGDTTSTYEVSGDTGGFPDNENDFNTSGFIRVVFSGIELVRGDQVLWVSAGAFKLNFLAKSGSRIVLYS